MVNSRRTFIIARRPLDTGRSLRPANCSVYETDTEQAVLCSCWPGRLVVIYRILTTLSLRRTTAAQSATGCLRSDATRILSLPLRSVTRSLPFVLQPVSSLAIIIDRTALLRSCLCSVESPKVDGYNSQNSRTRNDRTEQMLETLDIKW